MKFLMDENYRPISVKYYWEDNYRPFEFPAETGVSLAPDEYPLFCAKDVATTKGIWRKQKFIPWAKVEIQVDMENTEEIRIKPEGVLSVKFPMNKEFFTEKNSFGKDDWNEVIKSEQQNMEVFLNHLVKLCLKINMKIGWKFFV